jgi:nitric oxide dioxygenase
VVSLDNVNGELGADLLSQAIERPFIRLRPLGESTIIEIESAATLCATGNNLRVRGDMVRRTLVCDLDAGIERPELRQFRSDPVTQVVAELRRNYSISCAPNDRCYRISVKREVAPGIPAGRVSNWLHDHACVGTVLKVAAPAGDFFLDQQTQGPVVLVSGGVGLTPMVSMLETIAANDQDRAVWWVHGTQSGCTHAMRAHVSALTTGIRESELHTFYAEPLASDREGQDFDTTGLISGAWLARNTPVAEATYYLCGPKPFLRALVNGLAREGVPAERIRYEFFGPAEELLEAA